MIAKLKFLPSEIRNRVEELRAKEIKEINVSNFNDGYEVSVSGTDLCGNGFLKIMYCFKENN